MELEGEREEEEVSSSSKRKEEEGPLLVFLSRFSSA